MKSLKFVYSSLSKSCSYVVRNVEHGFCLILLALFLYLFFIKISYNQHHSFDHTWSTADWFISYAGGFVRRGLLGELINFLYISVDINPLSFLYKLRSGVYLSICLLFFAIAVRKNIQLIEMVLVLSPWSFMFELNDPIAGGRKESLLILVFLMFSILVLIKRRWSEDQVANPFYSTSIFWFLVFWLPVLTLAHEALFFFFGYFLILLILSKKSGGLYLEFIVPFFISVAILVLIYFFKGNAQQANLICARLIEWGYNKELCAGSVSAIGHYDFQIMSQYKRTLLIYMGLIFIPILCYGYSAYEQAVRNKMLLLSVSATLPTLVVFVVAQDWGRWLHISGLLLFITLFVAKPEQPIPKRLAEPILFFFLIVNPIFYIAYWQMPTAAAQFYEWGRFSNDLYYWLKALNLWWW